MVIKGLRAFLLPMLLQYDAKWLIASQQGCSTCLMKRLTDTYWQHLLFSCADV